MAFLHTSAQTVRQSNEMNDKWRNKIHTNELNEMNNSLSYIEKSGEQREQKKARAATNSIPFYDSNIRKLQTLHFKAAVCMRRVYTRQNVMQM